MENAKITTDDRVEKDVYQNRIEKRFATVIVLASYRLIHSISPVSAINLLAITHTLSHTQCNHVRSNVEVSL